MPAEFSSNTAQVIPVSGSVIFTETSQPCTQGLIYHKDGTSNFRVANKFVKQNINCGWRRNTNYTISFHANIAIPTGGTVEPISLAVAVDGEVEPASTMTITPAAVGEYGNVGAEVLILYRLYACVQMFL